MDVTTVPTVFMGTPEAAVPFFEAVRRLTDLKLVVTQPDRPRGRKRVLQPPPVKEAALAAGIPVLQPEKIRRNDNLRDHLREAGPAVIVVVAYGRILPSDILELPAHGCVNVHFSLLPKYRGAAPVNWAIVNGETETGVTLMRMDEGLDTGPIIAAVQTGIGPLETAPDLFRRLSRMGVDLLDRALPAYLAGDLPPRPQDHGQASLAPLMNKEDGRLDFRMPAMAIHNRVRGFQPWPGAFGTVKGRRFKIMETGLPEASDRPVRPGEVRVSGHQLRIGAGDGAWVPVRRIQPENRKPMDVASCVNGGYLKDGDRFDD